MSTEATFALLDFKDHLLIYKGDKVIELSQDEVVQLAKYLNTRRASWTLTEAFCK